MAQPVVGVCFSIDEDLKHDFDTFCNDLGLSMSAALILFMKTTVREQRIPFELSNKLYH